MSEQVRVAVVGATGAVGRTMLTVLGERAFPAREIVPFASARSAGQVLEGGLTVRALSEDEIDGFDIALFSAGSSVSREWAPRFAARGAVVVDNSSCWRMHDDVPLVVSEVNPEALDAHHGVVANPNCTAMQALVVLAALRDAVGLERIVFTSYQSTSGTGKRAIEELEIQTHAILHGMEPPAPEVYPHQIAFNVLPQVETFKDGDDYTTEERKVIAESRKILGLPDLRITVTCARVPVRNCHSEALNVETREELGAEECRTLLAGAPGVVVVDDPAAGRYPLASEVSGRDEVFVGRIRRDESNPRTLNMWIVGDNLRKGAATNAIQVAELLVGRGLLSGSRAARAAS
ncbi:MAG TPA: aspartate-semialdehyde dehydrogenase [Solirubrobacteraceae bacterium]|jgi:aspartate-semialdehyde dehydrogenase|nr:aspartate-semialdehyde dehydrogenase [Solirubrobacteraceae bacterium]